MANESTARENTEPPARFMQALQSIRDARYRPEVELKEAPAPARVAPFAAALDAAIPSPVETEADLAAGSLIILHDPAGQDVWQGDMRLVCLARANLEPEMGADPLLSEVAWSWLTDALGSCGIPYAALAGTVTRTLSESFGSLYVREGEVGIEVRASWTPLTTDIGAHVHAWTEFLCQTAGIEPLPAGVTPIGAHR